MPAAPSAAPAATPPRRHSGAKDGAAAPDDASSEAIAVYARLKPVGKGEQRGEVTVPQRFGKQKSMHVRAQSQGMERTRERARRLLLYRPIPLLLSSL